MSGVQPGWTIGKQIAGQLAAAGLTVHAGTGSLAWATGPQFPHRGSYAAYRSSKTALNALTVFYAHGSTRTPWPVTASR